MDINIVGIILASVAQFVVGAVWYTFIFGKTWGKMHGFDQLDKAVQKEMMSKMGPIYLGQFLATIILTVVLAVLISYLPNKSPYMLALLLWIGFIIPTQYSDVLFGGTEPKWVAKKLLILAGSSLVCLLAAAAILKAFP